MTVPIPARETATFVVSALGPIPQRILDVGCGDGELCLRLSEAGHRVMGIESDHPMAALAVARGVDCRECDWFSFTDPAKVDAVIFNRSLHHLNPLDGAVDHAASFLSGTGAILVEDFAFADTDVETVDWFRELVARTARTGGLDLDNLPRCFATDVLREGSQAWHHDHAETLHTADAMATALRARFESVSIDAVPYLYRYVSAVVVDVPAGNELVASALEQEHAAGASGKIRFIGRRFVARDAR
jgi:SAM-dependent methyltransferase